jgi:hypothetical protein
MTGKTRPWADFLSPRPILHHRMLWVLGCNCYFALLPREGSPPEIVHTLLEGGCFFLFPVFVFDFFFCFDIFGTAYIQLDMLPAYLGHQRRLLPNRSFTPQSGADG